jgi:hypothetical protein
MGCCDESKYSCDQGRNCPVRSRRVRAGQPAPEDVTLWVRDPAEMEAEMDKQWRSDLKAILFVASCVVSFFIIVLVTA